jgi:hypothetical protein
MRNSDWSVQNQTGFLYVRIDCALLIELSPQPERICVLPQCAARPCLAGRRSDTDILIRAIRTYSFYVSKSRISPGKRFHDNPEYVASVCAVDAREPEPVL